MLIETVVYKIYNKNGMLLSGKYILVVFFDVVAAKQLFPFSLLHYGDKLITLVVKIFITLKVKKLFHKWLVFSYITG